MHWFILDFSTKMRETMPRLNFVEKNSNGVKAKVLRNITNVNEPRKLTLRERNTPFNRIGLAMSTARLPHTATLQWRALSLQNVNHT